MATKARSLYFNDRLLTVPSVTAALFLFMFTWQWQSLSVHNFISILLVIFSLRILDDLMDLDFDLLNGRIHIANERDQKLLYFSAHFFLFILAQGSWILLLAIWGYYFILRRFLPRELQRSLVMTKYPLILGSLIPIQSFLFLWGLFLIYEWTHDPHPKTKFYFFASLTITILGGLLLYAGNY